MFSEIAGQLHQLNMRIPLPQAVHHLPGVVPGAVVYHYDFIVSQLRQNFLLHVLIEEFQCIRIVIYGHNNRYFAHFPTISR